MSDTIVVCDDSPVILKPIEFKLRGAGYDARGAVDGVDAWELMQSVEPALVITDLQMPRMDGLELAARMKTSERFADVPIILLTAKGFELDCEPRYVADHFAASLRKPFSPREVLVSVESILADCRRALRDTVALD